MTVRKQLESIANNLWWTWSPRAQALFEQIDPEVWERSSHSPKAVLRRVTDERLDSVFSAAPAAGALSAVSAELDAYTGATQTWCSEHAPNVAGGTVAYFCAEFGIHESLPIYSGGLGVLAGDHIKTTSDLGIPFVGVSLKYAEGYFRQRVDHDGWQQEHFPATDWRDTPIELVERDGVPLHLTIPLADRMVIAEVWRVRVGRSMLYLLDTNLPDNSDVDRAICRRLYGGDQNTRIRQEVILGVGGVRLLRELGIAPSVYHLNEGHSAFACFELVRERVGSGASFADAMHWVRERTLFTTHTPVPAGHDRFDAQSVTEAMQYYQHRMGIPWHDLIGLGRVNPQDGNETFCMTVLALKASAHANGVSKLHGAVSREMWADLFACARPDETPIGHITNGVHVETFMHPIMRNAIEAKVGPDWAEALISPRLWEERAAVLDDDTLLEIRRELKSWLFGFLKKRLARFAEGTNSCAVRGLASVSNWRTDVLTIGFARRFATYKRGDLIFRDAERASRLFGDPKQPIQLVIAGKAHPRDNPGKEIIRNVVNAVHNDRFHGNVVFVEDYDMSVGRALVSGVDVWLNTPRRPREASGTSGEKVPLHAGVNLSILDGWWAEGFHGDNGFAIGDHEAPADVEVQDSRDLDALYRVLETQVIPAYYAENAGGDSEAWRSVVRRSFLSLPAEYSTRRMLRDYAVQYYEPITANQR